MPYNFAADSFHTNKLCSRRSSTRNANLEGKLPFCVFEPPFGGLRGNVRWSSYARWKARMGLPISVNWTFFARLYGLGATSDYRFKIGDFAPTRADWSKISGKRGRPHQTFFFSEKLDKLSIVSYKNLNISFCRFVTIHASDGQTDVRTDRRTDGILIARPRLHSMQRGNQSVQILYHTKDHLAYSFLTRRMVGGIERIPSIWNFGSTGPRWSEIADL